MFNILNLSYLKYEDFINLYLILKIEKINNLTILLNLDEYLELFLNYNISFYKNQIIELKGKYLRCKADIENLKKRSNEDVSKTYKYAIEDFSENLLIVLDSLEATLNDKSNNTEKLLEGVRLTLKLLNNILEKNNIKYILPIIGDYFDPYKHLAISTVNIDKDNNIIVDILQKGYIISDRILRPALVIVNKVD